MKTVAEAYAEYLVKNHIHNIDEYGNVCAVPNTAIEEVSQLEDSLSFTDIRQTTLVYVETIQKYILQGFMAEYLPVPIGQSFPTETFGDPLPFVAFGRRQNSYKNTEILIAIYPELWDVLEFNSQANYNILKLKPCDHISNNS